MGSRYAHDGDARRECVSRALRCTQQCLAVRARAESLAVIIALNDDCFKHGTSLRPSLTRCYPSVNMPNAKQQPLPRTQDARWPWPDKLNDLTAAHNRFSLLFENEHVRVIRTR